MQVQILALSRSLARAGVDQLVLTLGFPGLPPTKQIEPGLTVRIARMSLPQIRSEITGLVGLGQAWLIGTIREWSGCVAATGGPTSSTCTRRSDLATGRGSDRRPD
nr:RecName: Full=Uncharacterized protein in grm 3'region [Micromonospora rosea]